MGEDEQELEILRLEEELKVSSNHISIVFYMLYLSTFISIYNNLDNLYMILNFILCIYVDVYIISKPLAEGTYPITIGYSKERISNPQIWPALYLSRECYSQDYSSLTFEEVQDSLRALQKGTVRQNK